MKQWLEPGRWLAAPFVVGTTLRLWYLHDQPLLDDELAAVRATLAMTPLDILFTYGKQDYFQLTAALARLLLDLGLPLQEWTYRLPTLLAGIAALWLLPTLVSRTQTRNVATILAWLLAISPVLVIYSRLARSYLPMTLCASAATFLLLDGLRSGARRPFLVSGALAGLAVWFHLMATPYLLGAWAATALTLAMDRSERSRFLLSHLKAGACIGAGVAALLILPAVSSLSEQLAAKSGATVISLATWQAAVFYLAGSASPILVLGFWTLAIVGLLSLAPQRPFVIPVLSSAIAAQFFGVWLLSPFGSNFTLVLTRYLMVALPALLLLVAAAIEALTTRIPARTFPIVGPAAAMAFFTFGPLTQIYSGTSSLAHHVARLRYLEKRSAKADFHPAVVQHPLLGRAEKIAWVVPTLKSGTFRDLELIDRFLGRRLLLVDLSGEISSGRLRFRNSANADASRLRALGAEVLGISLGEFPYIPKRRGRPVVTPEKRFAQREGIVRRLRSLFGEPVFIDSTHALWDLHRDPGAHPSPTS